MRPTKRWAASLVLGVVGAGCLHASAATPDKSELQKMRDMVSGHVTGTAGTREATLLQGAAAQHLLAATAGVPIFGMSDLCALEQFAGDPSAFGDLASLMQGDNSGVSPDDSSNAAVASADQGVGDANLDNGGESVSGGGSGNVGASSGNVNGYGGGGDGGASGGGGGGSASHFSEGGGAVAPLPSGALAGLLVLPALAIALRGRVRRAGVR